MTSRLTVLCLVVGVALLTGWAEGGQKGPVIGDSCADDSDCYDDKLICVGSPCEAVCQCKPGYKKCSFSNECIPDKSNSLVVGGNCTLDSECKGVDAYCRRLPKNGTSSWDLHNGVCACGDTSREQNGVCVTEGSSGHSSQQSAGKGLGGDAAAFHPTRALFMTEITIVVMTLGLVNAH